MITLDELFEKREDCHKRLKRINEAITALQYLCEHEWVSDGHDSHHIYEKCKLCRLTRSV